MNRAASVATVWIDAMRRGAGWVLLVSLLLTLVSLWVVVERFDISTDTTDMLSPDLPFRQRMIEMRDLFPESGDELVVAVEGATPGLAMDAATALAERLKAQSGMFQTVLAPAADPFFRRNGLLYLSLDDLEMLADDLSAAQPFLGTLWRDPSLAALADLLSEALTRVDSGDLPVPLDPVLEAISEVAEAQRRGDPAWLAWSDLMGGGGRADGTQLIVLRPVLDYGSLAPAARPMRAVRDAADDLGLTPARGVRVSMTGSVALDHEELASVEEGMGWAGVVSLTLVLSLLVLCFRSPRMVLAVLATLVMGLIWTAGLAFLAVGQLNLISIAFAVLFIGLSVDFGIHFGLRYREARRRPADHRDALATAARTTAGPLLLCAVAAAIAFYAFLPTDYVGLAQLGLIAGSGMFIALLANLSVLPALLTLLTPRIPAAPAATRRVSDRIARHSGTILILAGLAAVVAAPLALRVSFDFDPLHLKDPRTESVATLNRLTAAGAINPYTLAALADSPEAARDLADWLAELPEVAGTRTVARYVPADQEAKLYILEDLGYILDPAFTGRRASPSDDARTRRAVDRLRTRLAAAGADNVAAARLDAALAELGADPATLRDLEGRLLQTLPGRLNGLKESLQAETFGLSDLPPSILAREIATDGRVKVTVTPAGGRDPDSLRRFVDAVRRLVPDPTGSPVTILAAGRAVGGAFATAGVIALAGVGLLLAIVLRRGRDLLLVALPLLLAAEITMAGAALLGVSFNFANLIVLPLLVGLGVASGVHLVTRARETAAGIAVMDGSTPRAVAFSALTTVGSFGSIALSSHPGTASMGVLLTLALAATLVATMTVLPALLARGRR